MIHYNSKSCNLSCETFKNVNLSPHELFHHREGNQGGKEGTSGNTVAMETLTGALLSVLRLIGCCRATVGVGSGKPNNACGGS